jgi:uncharacterized protein (DUF302 family)
VLVTQSSVDHAATVAGLLAAIERRGLTAFATFDHAAGARDVGLELAEEQVVVFGNPKAGTLLMQSDPRVGIELPLRILVWDQGSQTMLGYRDPIELQAAYDVSAREQVLEQMSSLLADLVREAAS